MESTSTKASETSASSFKEVTLRVGEVKDTWAKHKLFEGTPILFGKPGDLKPSNQKVIFRKNGELEFVKILSTDYELFPNEELKERLDGWAGENGYSIFKDSRAGKNGHGRFLIYLPNDIEKDNYGVGHSWAGTEDKVRVGFAARNSIDGSIGFGLDVFTFRKLCNNGVIVMADNSRSTLRAGKATTASIEHKHTPNLVAFLDKLGEHMERLRGIGEQVIAYYDQLAQVQINEEIARALASTYIPKKYLPYEVDEQGKPKLDTIKGRKDMWSIYNDFTKGIWHNDSSDMKSRFEYFNALHNTLQRVVPPTTPLLVAQRRAA